MYAYKASTVCIYFFTINYLKRKVLGLYGVYLEIISETYFEQFSNLVATKCLPLAPEAACL